MTDRSDAVEALVQEDGGWLRFRSPMELVETRSAKTVIPAIARVEELTVTRGCHAVGFVTFEAGAAFGLRVHRPMPGLPLVWFAVFDTAPTRVAAVSDRGRSGVAAVSDMGRSGVAAGYDLGPMTPTVDRAAFGRAFDRIKQHIADGDTYQVNYTFRLEGPFAGDPLRLFEDLAAAQRGRQAMYLRVGAFDICSASPELFFSRTDGRLTARPMKGTASRGRTTAEDLVRRDRLRESPKERAENVMIVDMVRNDLGRVADYGTVVVPELLTVERYPTVWQMTSTITADSRAPLGEVFAALHPSASVTGAPKVRTMEILTDLEPDPRGIYTGAIGVVRPGGDASFNVAIRTAIVDRRKGTVSYGVGSGIVWDSEASAEYDECLLKAAVLGRSTPTFELLETIRWTPDAGFFLLSRHLHRLRDSAEFFGFVCRIDEAEQALAEAVRGGREPRRVRLLAAADGSVRVESAPLPPQPPPARLGLAREPVDPDDPFLFHKTTNRGVYERARRPGLDDVILWNPRGEITESTIANIVVEVDGSRVTPPVACGLLAGTLRAELLARGEIAEAVVRVEDLRRARRLWVINSVQEWRPATLVAE